MNYEQIRTNLLMRVYQTHLKNFATRDKSGVDAIFNDQFLETVTFAELLDSWYGSKIADLSKLVREQNPTAFRRRFTDDFIKDWDTQRPSLPLLALSLFETAVAYKPKGVEEDLDRDMFAKAMVLTALRGEMIRGQAPVPQPTQKENGYHSSLHFAHVAIIATILASKTPGLTLKQRLMVSLAALAHDLDHPGTANPANDVFYNEKKSFDVIKKIMMITGFDKDDIRQMHVLLLSTSPNGPHNVVKKLVQGEACEDLKKKYPEVYPLSTDKTLLQMAAILSDADLFASIGAGVAANRIMSERLTKEANDNGVKMDFRTAAAQGFFFKNLVTEKGFSSQAGQSLFQDMFKKLYKRFVKPEPKP